LKITQECESRNVVTLDDVTCTDRPVLGVLGGLGPAAGAEFFARFTAAWPAGSDQQHLRVLLWSDPTVPDRSAALLGRGPDPGEQLRAGVAFLRELGADIIAVPCNTAFGFLEPDCQTPDIVAVTVGAAAARARVGWLLATAGTCGAGLYHRASARAGFRLHVPPEPVRVLVLQAIDQVKAGTLEQAGRSLASVLAGAPRDCVPILGCTELSLAMRFVPDPPPVVDSLQALADECVRLLAGERRDPA
jgi:aspartate racemase